MLINHLSELNFANFTFGMTVVSVIGSTFVGIQLYSLRDAGREPSSVDTNLNFGTRTKALMVNRFTFQFLLIATLLSVLSIFIAPYLRITPLLLAIAVMSIPVSLVTTIVDGNLYGAGRSNTVQMLSALMSASRVTVIALGLSAGLSVPTMLALVILSALPTVALGLMLIPFKTVYMPKRLNSELILLSLHSLVIVSGFSIDIIVAPRVLGETVASDFIPAIAIARVASLSVHLAGYFSASTYLAKRSFLPRLRYKVAVHLVQLTVMVLIIGGSQVPLAQTLYVRILSLSTESVALMLPALAAHTIWSIVLGSLPLRARGISPGEVVGVTGIVLCAFTVALARVDEPNELLWVTSIAGVGLFILTSLAELRNASTRREPSFYE